MSNPGDYELTFEELRRSSLVVGPGNGDSTWDAIWRESLVGNLEVMTRQLWQVGVREVFVDGSSVEEKDHPNDIDGYFVCSLTDLSSGELTRKLNLLDPFKIWTWDPRSRQAFRGYPKKQLPMWHTAIASSCIRMWQDFRAVSAIRRGTSSSFHRPFASHAAMADHAALSN